MTEKFKNMLEYIITEKEMKSKFYPALSTLMGTMMGAGFLGIPFVVTKSGFIPGLIYILIIGVFMLLVKLYIGEIALRTNGNHQLAGYAGIYLGKWAKYLVMLSMIFGIYGALIAYMIGEGRSLSYLITSSYNLSIVFSLGFWLIMSFLTYIGLKALKKYEKISMFLIFLIIGIMVLFLSWDVKATNLLYTGNNLFLPFGVILFSFLAFSAIPEVKRILSGEERKMKKVIFWATLIPAFIYALFTLLMVGVFGNSVGEIATLTSGLNRGFSILGIITMFTAFFTSSLAIRDMFRFDFKLGRFKGWCFCSFITLMLFLAISLFRLDNFIQILSIAGILSGGLTGILALFMNLQSKKLGRRKPEFSIKINYWIILLLIIFFIAGTILALL